MNKPTIICGDSLAALEQMDSNIFDLALIDAPYFNYITGHRKDKEDKLSQPLIQQSRPDMIRTVRECLRILKNGRAFFFYTNWQEAWWFQKEFQDAGFLHNEIIWDKGNWTAGDLEGSFGNRYEVIFLGVKGSGWKYNGYRLHDIWGNEFLKGTPYEKYNLNRVGTNRIHSTEKPVDLYKMCIELASKEGDLIIDPYLGSAASAIAALELKRNFIGYEVDKEYYNRCIERVNKWQTK